jgi:xanthine dehydrogenase accessory factor
MTDELLEELLAAQRSRTPCALVTVAATKGSVPRAAGAKMLVYASGRTSGTIGGGKFESLVIADAQQSLRTKQPQLKTYPLRENVPESFGAICGGEATILIEPQSVGEAVFLIGGGHCGQAIAKLCAECGLFVTIVEDRSDLLPDLPPGIAVVTEPDYAKFIRGREWSADEALLIVSRQHELDRVALAAAIESCHAGYIGMIGSRRKVLRVFDHLQGFPGADRLGEIYAPLGLDIGADAPAEIAVSVVAEILMILRKRTGGHLRLSPPSQMNQ